MLENITQSNPYRAFKETVQIACQHKYKILAGATAYAITVFVFQDTLRDIAQPVGAISERFLLNLGIIPHTSGAKNYYAFKEALLTSQNLTLAEEISQKEKIATPPFWQTAELRNSIYSLAQKEPNPRVAMRIFDSAIGQSIRTCCSVSQPLNCDQLVKLALIAIDQKDFDTVLNISRKLKLSDSSLLLVRRNDTSIIQSLFNLALENGKSALKKVLEEFHLESIKWDLLQTIPTEKLPEDILVQVITSCISDSRMSCSSFINHYISQKGDDALFQKNKNGVSPITAALKHKSTALLSFLVSKIKNMKESQEKLKAELYQAASGLLSDARSLPLPCHLELATLLKKVFKIFQVNGVDKPYEIIGENGQTLLHIAIANHQGPLITLYEVLDLNAFKKPDNDGVTPLMLLDHNKDQIALIKRREIELSRSIGEVSLEIDLITSKKEAEKLLST